ncbi:RRP15-like protein [Perkinsela sp. CCAP 1560/4]|nr:RRP15-like protein [Perkinsela sp. CCAP 1560/4]|eukprot:KNH09377.1 RRP15-like protein [Perkinsela sp. CCAP 1560/4]
MSEYTSNVIRRILRDDQSFLASIPEEKKVASKEINIDADVGGAKKVKRAKPTARDTLQQAKKEKEHLKERQFNRKLRQELQMQPHLRKLPHHVEDEEYETKLRNVATVGVLKFLNAVSHETLQRKNGFKRRRHRND